MRMGSGDRFAIVRLYSAAGRDMIQISSDTLPELPIPTEPKSVETELSDAFAELKEGVFRQLTGEEAEPAIQSRNYRRKWFLLKDEFDER